MSFFSKILSKLGLGKDESAQTAGTASGGQPQFIGTLSRAAVAAGCDAVFVEVHDAPERALSDGANALRLDLLGPLWSTLRKIHEVAGA